MIALPRSAALLALGITVIGTACSSATDDSDSGGQDITSATGNPFEPGDCQVDSKVTGQTLSRDEIAKLNDPIANLVLLQGGGFGCPGTFSAIQEKLRTTDADKCPSSPGKPGGVQTRFVSDRAQLLGKPDTAPAYRGVVTRECSGRSDHELFLSIFGVDANQPSLPADVELIGEDKTRGVYNFYTREGGAWSFHGSSEDFVKSGYDCNDGACVPKISDKARCASCHVGGGLVMKELHTPWTNWEGATQTPGLDKLFSTFPTVLGGRTDGIDLEGRVTDGNQADWVPHRIEILKQMGTEDLLRPLFCSTDMNLQSFGGHNVLDRVGPAFFVDSTWDSQKSFIVDNATYVQKLAAHKQRISDSQGGQSLGTDTFFPLIHPERSAQDLLYVDQLILRHIVDKDFAKDVLAIDFTRPLYSATRCDLLKFAPTLTAAQLSDASESAQALKAGFITNLQGAVGNAAAAQLAKNLSTAGDEAAHEAAVTAFQTACTKRPTDQLLEDILGITAHLVAQVKKIKGRNGQGIIEFEETLPSNDIPDSPVGLDPVTCERTLQ